MSACTRSIHSATACSPLEKTKIYTLFLASSTPSRPQGMSCRPEELLCQESHPAWLPFFLNVLWAQSKLSASVKALLLSKQKVHLILMSTRFTIHAQNKYVKQPAPMLQRMCQVHALYNILNMRKEHQKWSTAPIKQVLSHSEEGVAVHCPLWHSVKAHGFIKCKS